MIKTMLATLIATTALPAMATTTDQLKFECSGEYKVLSSKAYYEPPPKQPTRALPIGRGGTKDEVEITALYGTGCAKLENYGIKLAVGLKTQLGVSVGDNEAEAHAQAASRPDKTFAFEAHQTFPYAQKGYLPLFPLVHEEWVQVLGFSGKADSKKLYGTPDLKDLTDLQIAKVSDELMSLENYGKDARDYGSLSGWMHLMMKLEPKSEAANLEYIDDLLLLFKNMTAKETSLYITSPATQIGGKLSQMLNVYGKSKWSSKIDILKRHPMLLEDQLVVWARPEALKLTAAEVEEFLEEALATSLDLSKVKSKVHAALILLIQYQQAAKTLEAHQIGSKQWGPQYEVSQHALDLIAQIKVVK